MINTQRHHEVFQASKYQDSKIVLVGAGAIGSRVFENLASLGLTNITVIDYDEVESHNLANQLFVRKDIGSPKIDGLIRWCDEKCGEDSVNEITFINQKVDKNCIGWFEDAEIVISCVDTFDARKMLIDLATQAMVSLFIDTRMTSSSVELYTCQPNNYADLKKYVNTIGDDDDPRYEVSSCGQSLTVGATAQVIGAQCCWTAMSWLKNEFAEPEVRTSMTPFQTHRS